MGLVLLIRHIYSRTLEPMCMQQNAKNAQKELFLTATVKPERIQRNKHRFKKKTQQEDKRQCQR